MTPDEAAAFDASSAAFWPYFGIIIHYYSSLPFEDGNV